MIKPFEFYFDFVSPYTFIAHKEIRKIEKENSIKMKYMPVLLGGLPSFIISNKIFWSQNRLEFVLNEAKK